MDIPKFNDDAYNGDTVEWSHDGFEFVATIHEDPDAGPPDRDDEGFWPSADPKDPGYIGEQKNPRSIIGHKAWATRVMNAWKNGEWFYCGVAVDIYFQGIQLNDEYAWACWGIECNYPQRSSRYRPNDHVTEMTGELAREALHNIEKMLIAAWRGQGHVLDKLAPNEGDEMTLEWLKAAQALAKKLSLDDDLAHPCVAGSSARPACDTQSQATSIAA